MFTTPSAPPQKPTVVRIVLPRKPEKAREPKESAK